MMLSMRLGRGIRVYGIWLLFGLSACLGAQNPKAKKHLDEAFMAFNAAEFPKALSSVNKALKADPKYADAFSLQASVYEAMRDTAHATESYRNCLRVAPEFQPMYFYYGEYLYRNKRLREAAFVLSQFDSVPMKKGFIVQKHAASTRLKEKAARLRVSVQTAMDDVNIAENLKIKNMGPSINTDKDEYWPGMPFSGDRFVFTRRLGGTGNAVLQEDFFMSDLRDTTWGKAYPAPGDINTPENEGTLSVKADGSALYYTRCNQPGGLGSCDLYVSDLDGKGWKRGNNLGSPVNGPAWDCQPAISGDGHTLIFASSRPGGFGGKDLWVSYLSQGKWSMPKNMGPAINTRDDDDAPFLHYDGATLYFSSLGHQGFGGSDIFMSRLGTDGQWSTPENLGSGLNTPHDEFGLYIESGGKKGYFASDRPGGLGRLDIYQFLVPEKFMPKPVTYVAGILSDLKTGLPLKARVRVVELSSGKVVFTDSVSDFFIPLQAGGNYALFATAKGYMPRSLNFQPTATDLGNPFSVRAELTPIDAKQVFVLNNIFFDTDKFDLKPESKEELAIVVDLMKTNAGMVIEISGHTDNQGAADYNLKLSESRAKSVVSYLVAAGVPAARLKFKGYGDSRPAATNDTEEGRAKNRRIELVILKAN
jgi:outer membrane protein OmpA-like peptidoglycan-associated protein